MATTTGSGHAAFALNMGGVFSVRVQCALQPDVIEKSLLFIIMNFATKRAHQSHKEIIELQSTNVHSSVRRSTLHEFWVINIKVIPTHYIPFPRPLDLPAYTVRRPFPIAISL